MPVVAAWLALVILLLSVAAGAEDLRTPSPAVKVACRCDLFSEELAAARAIFASRQDDVAMPLTPVMHDRYRARVDAAYGRADCLVACKDVPERERNRARLLLAEAGFKDSSLGAPEWRARLTVVLAEMTRCLEIDPKEHACQLWHASSRGLLARGSWNPLNLRLPLQLMAEFRAARGGSAPGTDHSDGAATRAEASMLLKVPRFAGGDPQAGRLLIEQAATVPRFRCRVRNRLVLVEALARTGDLRAAESELKSIVATGLPDCGPERYENALTLEEAERCLTRLAEEPDTEPDWNEDCRRPQ